MPRSSSTKSHSSTLKQKPYSLTPEAQPKDTSDPTIFPCTTNLNSRLTPHQNPGLYILDFVDKDGKTHNSDDAHIGVFYLGHIGDQKPIPVKTPWSVMCNNRSIIDRAIIPDPYFLNVRGMYEIRAPDGNSVKFTFIVTAREPVTTYRVVFHAI